MGGATANQCLVGTVKPGWHTLCSCWKCLTSNMPKQAMVLMPRCWSDVRHCTALQAMASGTLDLSQM